MAGTLRRHLHLELRVRGGHKHAKRVAPRLFGRIHRGVGLPAKIIKTVMPLMHQGATNADGVGAMGQTQHIRLVDALQNTFGNRTRFVRCLRGVRSEVFQHHNKLVAGNARHRVGFSYRSPQAGGDFFEQKVTRFMSVLVIDGFEIVRVHKQERPHLLGSLGGVQRVLYPVDKKATSGELGQCIGHRHAVQAAVQALQLHFLGGQLLVELLQFFFLLAPRVDVVGNTDQVFSVWITHSLDDFSTVGIPNPGARFSPYSEFTLVFGRFTAQVVIDRILHAVNIFWMNDGVVSPNRRNLSRAVVVPGGVVWCNAIPTQQF